MHLHKAFILIAVFSLLIACGREEKEIRKPVSVVQHPQWSKNVTIYELNIRQFSEEGTFKAVEQRLDEIADLGVGLIWLMPIHPIGEKNRKGTLGSPYSVKDYLAVNPEYGTEQDFRDLVHAIHAKGMYVIIDWVANHSAWDIGLTETHPEWFNRDDQGNFVPPNRDWSDVIDLNYDNLEMRRFMLDALKYWVREFDIDGYRCDVAELVPIDFWDQARRELDAIKPVFMLAESEAAYMHNRAFDMTYSWELYRTMRAIYAGEKEAGSIDSLLLKEKKLYPENAYRMRFLTNHDENSWHGTVFELYGEGLKAFAVLYSTLPGKPLLYSGQEAGMQKRLEFFEKDPIDWSGGETWRPFYSRLFNLYQQHPALYRGEMHKISPEDDEAVYAFARVHENDKIVVVLNLSGERRQLVMESPWLEGAYTELFSNVPLAMGQSKDFDLEPWGYRVFVAEKPQAISRR